MKRNVIAPRENEISRHNEYSFTFSHIDGEKYWDESVFYEFSLKEIENDIEDPHGRTVFYV